MPQKHFNRLDRRAFLVRGSLFLLGPTLISENLLADSLEEPILRIGLLTDIHYADKDKAGNRFYRESPAKLAVAAKEFQKSPPDFLVELGDFIDSVKDVEKDLKHLRTIDAELMKLAEERHYVLGNHCVETLIKEEYLGALERKKSYYSFDRKDWHFVILDACFRRDGEPYGRNNADWKDTKIPDEEIHWLRTDLTATKLPSIVFIHQRLDLDNTEAHTVENADRIREVFEKSGKVRLVLQGHDHRGGYNEIDGIHYCTISALIEGSGAESNSFSFLEIDPKGDMRLRGCFKQESRDWPTIV